MTQHEKLNNVVISTDKLKKFIIRRKWQVCIIENNRACCVFVVFMCCFIVWMLLFFNAQKTGNAIRAVGRMATLSASRKNSATNNASSTTSRPSVSGSNMSRMSSLNEDLLENVIENISESVTESSELSLDATCAKINTNTDYNNEIIIPPILSKPITESPEPPNEITDTEQFSRMRIFSERSDSGISDCSVVPAANTTPLLSKIISVNEETDTIDAKNIINTNSSNNKIATKMDTVADDIKDISYNDSESHGKCQILFYLVLSII